MDNQQQLENFARRRRTNRSILIVVGVIVGLLLVCGVVGAFGREDEAAEEATATTTLAADPPTSAVASPPATPRAPPPCYPYRESDDPELTAFTDSLTLPDGVHMVNALIATDSDYEGQVGVTIHLCATATSDAESLRPIATDIAKALRTTPLGDRTYSLRISDMGPDFNTESMIKVTRYSWHLWNGKPSPQAELDLWEVVHS